MQRNDSMILIRDVPEAIVEALDGVMATQGRQRVMLRELEEDFTPLLAETDGPLVFVLSQPHDDWTVCFSSLLPDDEWAISEMLAMSLEQPLIYALFSDVNATYAYRVFTDGLLHEEALPGENTEAPLTAETLLDRLDTHGVPRDLVDDRISGFGQEHLLVGYSV